MIKLAKRSLLLFFRDKAAVFFSLLGVIVIIGLYLLFLGDVLKSNFTEQGAGFLIDSWIMAGVIAVAPITTGLSAMSYMVEDQKLKIYKDFMASPIKRSTLAGGYIIGGFIISLVMTIITLILAEIYILMNGGDLLSWTALGKVLGIIVFYTLLNIFTIYFFVSFFKSANAFSAAATLSGTLIGFLTGIYIPIGNLPSAVQSVIKIFPPSHAAVLLRKVMMEPAEKVAFMNAPDTVVKEFRLLMGAAFETGDTLILWWQSLLYLFSIGLVFFLLSLWKMTRKKR